MSAWADNPQAAEIDAVVERAGELTHAEIEALHVAARIAARAAALDAARGEALDAARDAARAADRAAARAAALAAALDAAWDAALDAAWAAARDAARAAGWAANALAIHDLIDENTAWNQAAYDLLTGPWRRVIGPIHPDDEVLS